MPVEDILKNRTQVSKTRSFETGFQNLVYRTNMNWMSRHNYSFVSKDRRKEMVEQKSEIAAQNSVNFLMIIRRILTKTPLNGLETNL